MNSHSLAQEIEQDEARLNSLLQQLDSALKATHADIVGFASQWIDRTIKRHIEEYPKLIQDLGPDKLKSLKSDVEALKARLPDVVASAMVEKDAPHRERPEQSLSSSHAYGYRSQSKEPFFNAVVRDVISHLGEILNEYGLLVQPRDRYPEWKKTGDSVRYAINPGFDDRHHPNVMQYWHTYNQYQSLKLEVEGKRQELDKLKAKELWDSI